MFFAKPTFTAYPENSVVKKRLRKKHKIEFRRFNFL
jgi:hypothetical protein